MGEKADFEHLSEHDKYYLAQKSRKKDFAFAIVGGIVASAMLWSFSDIMAIDNPNFWLHHNIEIGAGTIIVSCVGISIIWSSKRVQKAKEALAGDLVSLNAPRWSGKLDFYPQGFILTKVHREDIEIGKQIHSDFSEDLDPEDVFFMFRAECTSVRSHTETWSMPRENYGRDGSGGYGGGYGGYGDSEYHGSTTYYYAKLKLKSTSTVFSASLDDKNWIKKGDIVDLLVAMPHAYRKIDRWKPGENCSVKILKSLNHQQTESDEL